jgi:hypothetical protein
MAWLVLDKKIGTKINAMNKMWTGLLLFVISLNSSAQKVCIKDLIGRWETTDGAGLEIIDSARIFVTYGKERKPILSYQADFSKSPCWFDFVVKDTAQKLSAMKSLLLLDKDVLKWQVFEDGDRPENFVADKGDIVILRRKK